MGFYFLINFKTYYEFSHYCFRDSPVAPHPEISPCYDYFDQHSREIQPFYVQIPQAIGYVQFFHALEALLFRSLPSSLRDSLMR